jgi:hypothetical protein
VRDARRLVAAATALAAARRTCGGIEFNLELDNVFARAFM